LKVIPALHLNFLFSTLNTALASCLEWTFQTFTNGLGSS
jgi:hypothetical protein